MHNFIKFFSFCFFYSYCADAHHKIYSAKIEEGRQSLEWRGHFNLDNQNGLDKEHHHVFETENSWNNYWQSEIEFHLSDKDDTPLDFEKIEFQNQVQIIDKHSLFTSLYFSYNFISSENKGDEIEYKLLNEYNNPSFNFITNFIFEKKVGKNSSGSTEFTVSNYLQFLKPLYKNFFVSIIGFSELGKVSNISTFHEQEHQYGFQIEKDIEINNTEYEFALGFLKSITDVAPDNTILWNLEYEF